MQKDFKSINIIKLLNKANINAYYCNKTKKLICNKDDKEISLNMRDIQKIMFLSLLELIENKLNK